MSTATRTSATLATSHEIRDRGSTFVGYVYRASTVEEARAVLRGAPYADGISAPHDEADVGSSRESSDDAKPNPKDTHTPYMIAAWRCMAVKPGRTGLGGPDDFTVQEGCDDGGERWAGGRVLGVMKREGVIDAVAIVCRWFGGTLLGPVRFMHIETCASEVCRRFKKIEEMDECVQTLNTLDDLLATLRADLATAREKAGVQDANTTENSREKRVPDYRAMREALDLAKAKRLIHARECSIKVTKALIEKCNTSM